MVADFIKGFGRVGGFGIHTFRQSARPPFFWGQIIEQMHNMCFRCLVPGVAVLAPLGAVVALQGLLILKIFGAEPLISSLVASAIFLS